MFGANNNQYGYSTFGQTINSFGQQNCINSYSPFSQNKNLLSLDTQKNALFGQHAHAQTYGTSIKYNPVVKTVGFASPFAEKLNCISCMDVYKNKSLEELRCEDYQLNQKAPTVPLENQSFNLPKHPSLLNTTNILDKPAFPPISKPYNDNLFTNLKQPSTPFYLMEPAQLPTNKFAPNFTLPFTSPSTTTNTQTNFSKKNDNLFSFNPSFKPAQLLPVALNNTTPAASLEPIKITGTISAFADAPVQQDIIIFPPVTNEFEAPGDDFCNNVQKVFQPFPRRDFLTNVGANVENRTTDPIAINSIINELRATNKSKSSLTNTYSPFCLNNLRQSFFEDVAKHGTASNRCLILSEKIKDKNTISAQNVEKCIDILESNSSSNTFFQDLQITVVKTKNNINYTTIGNKNVGVTDAYPDKQTDKDNDMLTTSTNTSEGFCVEVQQDKAKLEKLPPVYEKNSKNKSRRCLDFTEESHSIGTTVSTINLNRGSNKTTETKEFQFAEKVISIDRDIQKDSGDFNFKRCNVKLTKKDYYTEPPLGELYQYFENDRGCYLSNFVIGKKGYGNIRFLSTVNIADMDLDEIIDIDYRVVTVYPDDDKKPPVGEGLNVKAEITLDQIWPLDRSTTGLEKTNFINKLKRLAGNQNSSFVNYLPDTGSWIFSVEHF